MFCTSVNNHFMGNKWGNSGNCQTLFWGALKSLQMVTVAMKLKDTCSLKKSYDQSSSVQFSRSVMSDSATPWITARQASLSSTNSQSSPRFALIITFLQGSKHPLISWLQSPSAVILEPPKIKSDSFPIYFLWSDGTKYHDLSFLNVEHEANFFTLLFHIQQEAF